MHSTTSISNLYFRMNDFPSKKIYIKATKKFFRAMEKLRRLELTDKIKDFYRDKIEKTSLTKQQVHALIIFF